MDKDSQLIWESYVGTLTESSCSTSRKKKSKKKKGEKVVKELFYYDDIEDDPDSPSTLSIGDSVRVAGDGPDDYVWGVVDDIGKDHDGTEIVYVLGDDGEDIGWKRNPDDVEEVERSPRDPDEDEDEQEPGSNYDDSADYSEPGDY